ncbi:MAG: MaoC/PaaZ C-terminal domain-containing protein [bacterium]
MLLDKGNDENDKYNAPKMESYRDIQTIFDAYKDTGEQFTYVSEPIIATAEYTEKFADLTGDHNPIHVDPNPKFTSRFGSGRIRHGISTVAQMEPEIFKIFNIQQQEEIIAYKYTITYKKPVKI